MPEGSHVPRREPPGRGVAAVRDPRYRDTSTVGGLRYTYYVRSFAAGGLYGPPSGAVTIAISLRKELAAALS